MQAHRTTGTFEDVAMPHLDAAYNLARWLMRKEHDAEDVVQEAFVRAFNAFDRFQGGDGRCWLLTIVRNTAYTCLARNRQRVPTASFDEALHDIGNDDFDPVLILQQRSDQNAVRKAIEALPLEFREVLILREFEGLSYQQIASIAELPIGTVMSRLARARSRLERALITPILKEA